MLFSITIETASFSDFLYWHTDECEYDNWVSHISEGIASEGYNLYAPWDRQTNGFGDFYLAEEEVLEDWETVVETFLLGDYEGAQVLIDGFEFPYKVVEFNDIETGRTYYLIRENLDMSYYDDNGTAAIYDDEEGSFNFGWGLYIYNPQSDIPVIVTAPHPNDDFITSAVSYKCFVDWNAMFLLINGAGREVMWTQQGSYTNSKSLSDPSRNDEHAFNYAYKLFCDKIREDFGRREFSPQIHSYDWNKHSGYPDCQISAGYNKGCPNLPIRDLSDLKIDIINASNHLMIPENTIGTHPDVYLNDYYSVNYDIYDFIFISETGRAYPVNNQVDLEGYSQNRQMLYTFSGWNRYDVFEPFFHLEMDELPNCYEETEDIYKWFYSFNQMTGTYDMSQLFDNTLEYYTPWIDAATEILPDVIELDDNLIPDTPTNFTITEQTYDTIILNWESISSFDFKTFEILYDNEPIAMHNYQIIDRYDHNFLASPLEEVLEITDLELNQQYYFQIRAKDYNGNVSALSEEITSITAPVIISDFIAIGQDNSSMLIWTAEVQSGNQGFNVYRRTSSSEYILIDSWETNPVLAGSSIPNLEYTYYDNTARNYQFYYYMLSSVNEQGIEYFHEQFVQCRPEPIFELFISDFTTTMIDTVAFSKNTFASDSYDEYYDIEKEPQPPSDFVYAAFYEPTWGQDGMYLAQETHNNYNPLLSFKIWNLRIATDQLNEIIEISVSSDYNENHGKLYLRDNSTGQFKNLLTDNLYYVATSSNYKSFTLYWGNLFPQVIFSENENKIYKAEEELHILWNVNYIQLVEYLKISTQNENDSIFIADQVDPYSNHFIWTVPDFITFHNGRIVIDVVTIDEEIIREMSPYRLGIVPSVNSITYNSGWQLVSNPWISGFAVEIVFGENAELYIPIGNDEYLISDMFEFGYGYWLNAPESGTYSCSNPIQSYEIEIPMINKWNLLPNPHLCSYKLSELRFILDGSQHSYSYMLEQQYIANAFYIYHDNKYQMVDTIEPTESFYIYANIDSTSELSCKFIPYYGSYFNPTYETDWDLNIIASQLDSDKLTFGVSFFASDDFDFKYDLPEPPVKPFEDGLELYFPKDLITDTLFIYDRLNCEYKSRLSYVQPDIKTWDFCLKINQLDAITLNFDLSELPEGYHATININGNSWNDLATGNYLYSFAPSQIGLLEGQIEITNNLWTSTKDIIVKKIILTNYPNPFNPSGAGRSPTTTIQFTTSLRQGYAGQAENTENTEIIIYNIKGQKVKTLVNKVLPAGEHSVVWNGRDSNGNRVGSGIYFYQLNVDGKTKAVKKMILLK